MSQVPHIDVPDKPTRRPPAINGWDVAKRTPLFAESPLFFGIFGTVCGYAVQFRIKNRFTGICAAVGVSLGWFSDFSYNLTKASKNWEYMPNSKQYENTTVDRFKLVSQDGKTVLQKVE